MIDFYTIVCSGGTEVYFYSSISGVNPLNKIKSLLLTNKYKCITLYTNYVFTRDYTIIDIINGVL